MLDTHAVARSLTESGIPPAQADAITAAVRQAAEHGDHGTADQFRAGMAEMETRLYRAMLIQAGAIVGAVVAILRMLGS